MEKVYYSKKSKCDACLDNLPMCSGHQWSHTIRSGTCGHHFGGGIIRLKTGFHAGGWWGCQTVSGVGAGGGLPAIPTYLLARVKKKAYVELAEFLPEKIEESFLYPEGSKTKVAPIEKFVD